MNIRKFGLLLSVSTLIGVNIGTTKALTQTATPPTQEPSIQFGKALFQGTCTIENQLAGEDGRTLAIAFGKFQSENGGSYFINFNWR
jgi:hypothetical protein